VSIVCLGDINIDILLQLDYPLLENRDRIIKRLKISPGGSAANTAVALSRLGLTVKFVGTVGKDVFGNYLRRDLEEENVCCKFLGETEKAHTGLIIVLVKEDGRRVMFSYRGANIYLTPERITPEIFSNAILLHVSGYCLLSNPQRASTIKCMEIARERGCICSFDYCNEVAEKGLSYTSHILRMTKIVFLNEEEANMLAGSNRLRKLVEKMISLGPEIIVLKRGDKGCTVFTSQGYEKTFPTINVKVVDTTGAGDAFNAGFIYGYIRGWEIERAAKLANYLGSKTVTKIGARAALPSKEECRRLLKKMQSME